MKTLESQSVGLGKANRAKSEALNGEAAYQKHVEGQNGEILTSQPSDFVPGQKRNVKNGVTAELAPDEAVEIRRNILMKLTIRFLEEGLFIK